MYTFMIAKCPSELAAEPYVWVSLHAFAKITKNNTDTPDEVYCTTDTGLPLIVKPSKLVGKHQLAANLHFREYLDKKVDRIIKVTDAVALAKPEIQKATLVLTGVGRVARRLLLNGLLSERKIRKWLLTCYQGKSLCQHTPLAIKIPVTQCSDPDTIPPESELADEVFNAKATLTAINQASTPIGILSERSKITLQCEDEHAKFIEQINPLKLLSGEADESAIKAQIKAFQASLSTVNLKIDNVGGLHEQREMLKKIIFSRLLPEWVTQAYGIKPVNGILFVGPPGTGKTLTARNLLAMAKKVMPKRVHFKIISGTDVLNKYVGESERRVRALFEEAENKPEGHFTILYIDEIDAMVRDRNLAGSGSQISQNLTTTILSKMDGIKQNNKILIIGSTNNPEQMDKAALRAGRFGHQLKFGLPNHTGRIEILKIHTLTAQQNQILDPSIDFNQLAELSKGFTGAELMHWCQATLQRVLSANYRFNDSGKVQFVGRQDVEAKQNPYFRSVTMADFQAELTNIKPQHLGAGLTQAMRQFKYYLPELKRAVPGMVNKFRSRTNLPFSLAITGPAGSGKLMLARHICQQSGMDCIEEIDYKTVLGLPFVRQMAIIDKIFKQALMSDHAAVVFRNVEHLLGSDPRGGSYSNNLRVHVLNKLSEYQEKSNLNIIFTSRQPRLLKEWEILDQCDKHFQMPLIRSVLQLQQAARLYGVTIKVPLSESECQLSRPLPISKLVDLCKQFKAEHHSQDALLTEFVQFANLGLVADEIAVLEHDLANLVEVSNGFKVSNKCKV